jgi:hypothetical protein
VTTLCPTTIGIKGMGRQHLKDLAAPEIGVDILDRDRLNQ